MFGINAGKYYVAQRIFHAPGRSVVLLFCCLMATNVQAEPCTPEVARAISVQGSVEVRQEGGAIWSAVQPEQIFCPGQTIHVPAQARAALYLSNGTIMRLDQRTTVTLPPSADETSTWLNLVEGVAHFISRIKHSFEVTTPFVNAAVEGTEFVVAVDQQHTDVTVFEGQVRTKNSYGELLLSNGESARTLAGQAPLLRILLHPRDAVQWALYYPAVTEYNQREFADLPQPWAQQLQASVELYHAGNAAAALAEVENLPDDLSSDDLYLYRAALYLTVGQVEQANIDLQRTPNSGDALALQAIIALTNNDTAQAAAFAQQAIAANPEGVAPHLALSYVYQAQFDIAAALQAAQQAQARGPDNALTQARIAELYLAQGRHADALVAAQQAASLNPALSRAQSVLGFTYLARTEIDQAQQRFQQAIELDQADPLPRMGLGLAMIRNGNLEEGRRQLEFAASLDPNNSMIRSYLGKAYYEERRDALAASQLAMAKALDPNDPTPWLYDATVKQSSNRPVQALRDLQTSIALNDNRAVYRSRLLLDGDQAARSASLAKVYQDLGFNRAALLQGWRSLNSDPSNNAAHRLLADAYANTPRHEIARVSELLQAQLLQPINIVPVSPQATEGSLAGAENAGISLAGLNEYSPLFTRDGAALRVSGTIGNHGSRGDELVVSGIQGRASYSLGQFHSASDGARENSDYKQNIYNAFAQFNITENFSTQFEYRQRESSNGDLQQLFDTSLFDVTLRDQLDAKTSRLGFHYTPSLEQDVIGSVIYSDKNGERQAGLNNLGKSRGTLAELQHILRLSTLKSVVGLGYLEQWNQQRLSILLPDGLFFPLFDQTSNIKHRNVYVYSYVPLVNEVTLTLGLSYDSFDKIDEAQINPLKQNQLNPKAGLVWQIAPATSFRLAAFRTLKRPLLANQTIEPTQIAGFNQFFDDSNAADTKVYGIGLDHALSEELVIGAETMQRRLINHSFDPSINVVSSETRDEWADRVYLYWTPQETLGLSAEYRREDFSRPIDPTQVNFVTPYELTSQYLPLTIAYYHAGGFFSRWGSTYIQQEIDFGPLADKGRSDFWLSGITAGYRMTRYRGLINLRIDNLFNKDFKFQSVNFGTGTALPPAYPSARQIALELRLWFR